MPSDNGGHARARTKTSARSIHFQEAIEAVLEKKLSVREAARKFAVPRTTLQRQLASIHCQSTTNAKGASKSNAVKSEIEQVTTQESRRLDGQQKETEKEDNEAKDSGDKNSTKLEEEEEGEYEEVNRQQQVLSAHAEQPATTTTTDRQPNERGSTDGTNAFQITSLRKGREEEVEDDDQSERENEFVISRRKKRHVEPKKAGTNPMHMVLRSSPNFKAAHAVAVTPDPIALSNSTLAIPSIASASTLASSSAFTTTAMNPVSLWPSPPTSSLMQAASHGPHHAINCKVRMLAASAGSALDELSNKLILDGKVVYKLGLGQSPFPIPQCIVDELRANSHQRDYLPVAGLPSLCEDVAAYANRSLSLSFTRHNVLIGPGTKELLFLLQTVYYGDLLLPNPSCTSYAPQATIAGRNMFWLPTYAKHRWVLRPEVLEAHCVSHPEVPRILILNSPSNPTGCVYNDHELEALAQIARKYRILVVSDELYAELHHTGEHVSMAQWYPEGTIISGGLSKWCGAGGWRMGFWIFPTNMHWLRKNMLVMASETYTSVASPIQYAARRAFVSDCMELSTYKEKCRKTLQIIGQWCAYRLERMGAEGQIPQGGFYLFPCFQKHRDMLAKRGIETDVRLCERLLDETGVAILPGSHFGRAPEELYVRVAYVDFRGEIAMYLINSTESLESQAIHGFIQSVCPNLDIAMHKLANWLSAPNIST